jgi:plasmid maintenance system killer protein
MPWLRLHHLSGQRSGQFSIVLDRRWRLILTLLEEENRIIIEEVTNHYGD